MDKSDQKTVNFEITEKLKTRAFELLDESQAIQFAEGIRLNNAVSNVFARERERLALKYGEGDPRTNEMQVRMEANAEAKTALHARYTEASTPQPDPADKWVVDGFVRTADLQPVKGVTVAAYDLNGGWNEPLGHACTDKTGYFTIVAAELYKREVPVYMRASKGKKLLESNQVQLVPTRGVADRIEIIIGKRDESDDCEPPTGGKGERLPPSKPVEPAEDIKVEPAEDVKKDMTAKIKGTSEEAQEKAREAERLKVKKEVKEVKEVKEEKWAAAEKRKTDLEALQKKRK